LQIQRTNTILYCHLWAETVAFYSDVFAFSISHQTDWFVEFEIAPSAYLSIADEKRATIKSVGGQGITLSWEVAHVQDMHKTFLEQGIKVSPIQNKWGAALLYLHDPEGHRIELWQPLA
jgi:catechol 2,3-dioxygenase-like lactoylglutathione lyase family enzyme